MVPLELGIGTQDQKTRVMALPGRERSLTVSSAAWIQSNNVTDTRTDGHQATEKPGLRIPSRGKNATHDLSATAKFLSFLGT